MRTKARMYKLLSSITYLPINWSSLKWHPAKKNLKKRTELGQCSDEDEGEVVQAALLHPPPSLPPHHPRLPRVSPLAPRSEGDFSFWSSQWSDLGRLPRALLNEVVLLQHSFLVVAFSRGGVNIIRSNPSKIRCKEKANTSSSKYFAIGICAIRQTI